MADLMTDVRSALGVAKAIQSDVDAIVAPQKVSTGKVADDWDDWDWKDNQYVEAMDLELIEPWEGNPRKSFDETALAELAQSIAANGVQQPIVVRWLPDRGMMSIVMGESRYRASLLAGKKSIPARIRLCMDDQTALELALTENAQRKDLTPMETARALQRLVGMGAKQSGLAKRLGMSESAVSNALRVLALPQSVLDLVDAGKIDMTAARSLARFARWPEAVTRMAELLVSQLGSWSARDVERSVPGLWWLQNSGLAEPLNNTSHRFDWKANCVDCPFGAYYADSEEREVVCFRPEHYRELLAKAQEQTKITDAKQIDAKIAEAKATGDETKLPKIGDFAYGSFQALYSNDARPEGCSESCPCAKQAIVHNGVVQICTDPKRLRNLTTAQTKRKRVQAESEVRSLLDTLVAIQADSAAVVPMRARGLALTLTMLMRQIGLQGKKPFEMASSRISDPVIREIIKSGGAEMVVQNVATSVAESLSRRPYTELINAITTLLLCERLAQWLEIPSQRPDERINLLLGTDDRQ